jgi:hypothetical protein
MRAVRQAGNGRDVDLITEYEQAVHRLAQATP